VNNRERLTTKGGQADQMTQNGSGQMTVSLSPQGNSGESGIASLGETDGRVTVNVALAGNAGSVAKPAHIHAGTCPGVGAISYPLNPVVNGRSTTVLNVSMAGLMQQLPLVINVHKSAEEISTYTSCGAL
jgi:hypothetical protein